MPVVVIFLIVWLGIKFCSSWKLNRMKDNAERQRLEQKMAEHDEQERDTLNA